MAEVGLSYVGTIARAQHSSTGWGYFWGALVANCLDGGRLESGVARPGAQCEPQLLLVTLPSRALAGARAGEAGARPWCELWLLLGCAGDCHLGGGRCRAEAGVGAGLGAHWRSLGRLATAPGTFKPAACMLGLGTSKSVHSL